jgi:hypothetical protein
MASITARKFAVKPELLPKMMKQFHELIAYWESVKKDRIVKLDVIERRILALKAKGNRDALPKALRIHAKKLRFFHTIPNHETILRLAIHSVLRSYVKGLPKGADARYYGFENIYSKNYTPIEEYVMHCETVIGKDIIYCNGP